MEATVTTRPLEIGRGFSGQIDDIRIYAERLTAAAIRGDMSDPA